MLADYLLFFGMRLPYYNITGKSYRYVLHKENMAILAKVLLEYSSGAVKLRHFV
jgi:hypothetical protein